MLKLFSHLWRYRWHITGGLLALFVVDLGQIFIPYLIEWGIEDVRAGQSDRLLGYAGIILGIGLVLFGLRFVWRYLIMGAARRVRRDLRDRLYDHVLKFASPFFQENKPGDLMAHFSNDTSAVQRALGLGVLAMADFFFISGLAIGFMLTISPTLTLYTLLPMPVLTLFVYVGGKIIHHYFQQVQDSFSRLSDRVQEAFSGVEVIKSYAREPELEADFEEYNRDYRDRNLLLAIYHSALRPSIRLLSGIALLIALYFGGRMVMQELLTIGELVRFLMYLVMLTWPMMALGWSINLLQRGRASLERIDRIMIRDPRITDQPAAFPLEGPGHIKVRDLSFSYDDEEKALENVSFEVEPETSLGIVGRTGAGKSTLVNLFGRVQDPPPGHILLDDRDIREYALQDLRRQIAFVPQDGFLFSSSVRENISFGRPEADLSEIREVARRAGIHDEIEEMPKGYDSLVGERGVSLSGGQKQRISIARALITDPKILILDDALSAVDARKEEEVLENLQTDLRTRTSIVIAHRISAVRSLDHILVMDGGKIVQRGTHGTLVEEEGLYARMYQLQQAGEEALGS